MSQPEITDEAESYYAAFVALQRDRPILAGMAVALPLPVPRTMIEAHARRLRIDESELYEFVEIVAAIDDSYVDVEVRRVMADLEADKRKKG
jgi:hypothetical protein